MDKTNINKLPLNDIHQFETRIVLKKTAEAHRYLAELKGIASSIPNEAILLNTLSIQEAKDSSEVENIFTTHDELFKYNLFDSHLLNPSTKEVQDYVFALKNAFINVRENKLILLRDILDIQRNLEHNHAGLRTLPGTELKNARTGEVVYRPPQNPDDIAHLMDNLLFYINDDAICDADPLVKMAIIHHQFETIHPFYDGNGRTGRILNILYLVAKELLNLPILYLSRYIIRHKKEYYQLIQSVRDNDSWEDWIIFILNGIIDTAQNSIELITQIRHLMQETKDDLKTRLPKIYSQDLLNNLFSHPYTKVDFIIEELDVSRITATRYLDLLVEHNFLQKQKIGRGNYYMNMNLVELLKMVDS